MNDPFRFIDAGTIDGITYVDVLNATGDPIEYSITLTDAVAAYGKRPVLTMAQEAER